MSNGKVAYVTFEYAFHCVARELSYSHYSMNFRRVGAPDTFKVTYEQYMILESMYHEIH